MMMIALRQAVVDYRSGTRVGPVDFEMDQQAMVWMTGANGSGKTTVIELLAGRLRPRSGSVTRPRGREALAVLPQSHRYHREVPVRVEDVVGFSALAGGWYRPPDRTTVARALDRVGAASLAGRVVAELSGGQRQIIQLARLVAQGAVFWLLDEPLGGLDPEWRHRVLGLLESLHREDGIGMLVVSHLHDEMPADCRRVLVMDRGRLVGDGPPARTLGGRR